MEILVYAKTKEGKQFIDVFDDLSSLSNDVFRQLELCERLELAESTYFLLNGEEFRLFLEGTYDD